MIPFQPLTIELRDTYNRYLQNVTQRGCEYSFVNLYLWGRQQATLLRDHLVFFSQFNRRSVYLFPVGNGDKKPVLDAVMEDARTRGIPCRFTGMSQEDCALVDSLYPGKFRFHPDRNSFDYVYAIEDLALLKGRKFQRKRNHLNRFWQNHPEGVLEPISAENCHQAEDLVRRWYDIPLLLPRYRA